ncbi:hypothetical protein AVEN_181474-1 [Araneus ventricosus]|uniref:Endonuclease/exonuclease/phosphatase domain-containing protein n=1 Tax=Araneus ventricosus TaxID=182803 RepID=A0A4Y2SUV4_ARAVE|nr:hypothetical protein AVEN_181474-1 [Araneus ventricosus]
MAINLISWNCHGFRAHSAEFKTLINKYQPICICIQETYLSPNIDPRIANYSFLRKDNINTSRATGGVAIVYSNLFPSKPVCINTPLQAVAIQIHIKMPITICTIYLPPHQIISLNELDNLIVQLPTPFILLGDLNGHSTLWGSDATNNRGLQIEKLISDNKVECFNRRRLV